VAEDVRGSLRGGGCARAGGVRRLSPAARCLGLLATIVAPVAVLGACADAPADSRAEASPPDSAVVVVDAAGRSVRFDAPPTRILPLVPAVTTMLLALELAAVRDLPSVGNGLLPDLERLLTLSPDLVVRFHGLQDQVTGPALDKRGIAHLGVRLDGIEDVRQTLLDLGRVTRREERAHALLAALDADLAEVRARVGGRPRVRAAYVLGGDPPYVAGPGTFLTELLDLAGADNVFADLDQLYAPVSVEELIVRRPDVIVVGRGTDLTARLRARARVLELSPDVESPSLRLGRSAREMAQGLHPEAFR
jgi:ABC-type Fe3+-hydroxamate transport system substrate-binding protein